MNTAATHPEPRPFEEVIIASTLESASGQEALMGTIHRLSQERSQLQIRLAQHPWSDREAAARIQAITTELEECWAQVRRSRAARRVRMEEALGVDPAAGQMINRPATKPVSPQAAPSQSRRRRQLPLAHASLFNAQGCSASRPAAPLVRGKSPGYRAGGCRAANAGSRRAKASLSHVRALGEGPSLRYEPERMKQEQPDSPSSMMAIGSRGNL